MFAIFTKIMALFVISDHSYIHIFLRLSYLYFNMLVIYFIPYYFLYKPGGKQLK